jgi:cytoplasmic iron level regulating protein YaaA (DUF328/UPF0246 family)
VLVLLPPSETKRGGGTVGSVLDITQLSFPQLHEHRDSVVSALGILSEDPELASAYLKIGPSLAFEIERNRQLRSSAVMPAIDRYTGVLYDALDSATLTPAARAFLANHVAISSALFGLVRAGDPIPAYRLSASSKVPNIKLKAHWSTQVSAVLAEHPGFVLDLRSESYVSLGPVPAGVASYFVRVVTESADGTRRALNHFNKKGKGEFVRALAEAAIDHESVNALLTWAANNGIRLVEGAPGELDLVV